MQHSNPYGAPAPYKMPASAGWSPPRAVKDSVAVAYDQNKDAELFVELAGLTASAPLDHYFSNLHRSLSKVFKAPIMVVGVKDVSAAEGFRPRFKRDLSHADGDPSIEQRFIDAALRTAKPVLHGQLPKLPTGGYLLQPDNSVGSVMVAPLMLEGRVLGYIAVRNPNDGVFDETDLGRFTCAANIAALVVQNELTMDEAIARRAELALMLETARALASERDLVRFFETFHGLVRGVMDAETFMVGLGTWNTGGQISVPYCVHHHTRLDIKEPLPINGTVSGHVFREGMPLILRAPLDWRLYPVVEQGSRDKIQSGIVIPLQNGHHVIGVVSAQSSKPNAYSVRERDLLETLAELVAIAVETSRRNAALIGEPVAEPARTSDIPKPPVS